MSPPPVLRQVTANAVALAAILVLSTSARAEYIIDLTRANTDPITYQDALYAQTNLQRTGTGVFDPFVRIQIPTSGTEAGYNTDARPVEFQTKDENQWTRSLTLNSLQAVAIDGTQYYQFTLDVNEEGSPSGKLLSLNDVQVYLGSSGSLTGFIPGSGFGTDASGNPTSVKIYDLDGAGDATVELDYKLNPGSGSGDLTVYIPVALFEQYANSPYQYVYLYSAFGNPNASDAGFEEWSALTVASTTTGAVPAPPGMLLGLIGLGGCLLGRGFRRRATAAVA